MASVFVFCMVVPGLISTARHPLGQPWSGNLPLIAGLSYTLQKEISNQQGKLNELR
jgi:hypothetical protein